jgi:hypothetical protein
VGCVFILAGDGGVVDGYKVSSLVYENSSLATGPRFVET